MRITARDIFAQAFEFKIALWRGAFWGRGYYINSLARHSNEKVIALYVKNQGEKEEYEVLHKTDQLNLL
jgi:REP element-mobilizing transposase RayT